MKQISQKSSFSSPGNEYLTPAVNRQPGFRRDTCGASFLENLIYVCIQKHFMSCFIQNLFSDFSDVFMARMNFSRAEIDMISPREAFIFIFWLFLKSSIFVHFSLFLVSERDFFEMLTYFLSFQKALRGKCKLLCRFSWCFEKIDPNEFKTFGKSSRFIKRKCKRLFPWRILILPIPCYSMNLEEALRVIFNLFRFSLFWVPEGDFVAMITSLLSFQKASRGKCILLWVFFLMLSKDEPKQIYNF